MIRFFISLLFSLLVFTLYAEEQLIVRVWLSDKEGCQYSTLHPEEFLSERCIKRHKREMVNFSQRDLPISEQYKEEIMTIAKRMVCHSKWLNTLVVECSASKITSIKNLPFVENIEILSPAITEENDFKSTFSSLSDTKSHPLYGVAYPIIKSVKATQLHKKGCWGKGSYIAILDDGFGGVDTLSQWFDKERIKFSCDVVNPNGNIYREDEHGTAVLSVMLANKEGEFVGIAPQSDYALIRTENIKKEVAYEEDFWVRGVEIADSLGVDIITSSLGYEQFENIISVSCLAAEIATNKGITVVTSCGNKGNEGFTNPANTKGVIAVGGIDRKGRLIDFSSKEFVNGKYIAPEARGLASDVPIIDGSGKIMCAYGTSFAAPAITGSIAIKESF